MTDFEQFIEPQADFYTDDTPGDCVLIVDAAGLMELPFELSNHEVGREVAKRMEAAGMPRSTYEDHKPPFPWLDDHEMGCAYWYGDKAALLNVAKFLEDMEAELRPPEWARA